MTAAGFVLLAAASLLGGPAIVDRALLRMSRRPVPYLLTAQGRRS